MQAVFDLIETVAPTKAPSWLDRESGTGKELVARAIHGHSLRRDHAFVALNGARCPKRCSSRSVRHMRAAVTGRAVTKGLLENGRRGPVPRRNLEMSR